MDGEPDHRRTRVLDASMGVFLNYGFARATMDDIARAAEMSRPALYLVFKNKGEIYRALATETFARSVEAAGRALARNAPLGDRLRAAVEAGIFDMLEAMTAAPHGGEILDLKNTLAGDLATEWRRSMHAALAGAIEAEAESKGGALAGRGLTAGALADGILDGLDGLKARGASVGEQRAGLATQLRMVELALRP